MLSAKNYIELVKHCDLLPRSGKVLQFYGLAVEASGPAVFLGEICEIYAAPHATPVLAEVVGFRDNRVILMPYGTLHGISVGSEIIATGKPASVKVGPQLVGRVVNAFCSPLDGDEFEGKLVDYPLYPEAINPLERANIKEVFETGVKAMDTLLTIGKGQRIGLFSGSGVGKSSLLGMVARNSDADVNVIAMVGERGREVRAFIEDALGEEGMRKSVVIVATADEHALVRTHAALAATAIAEYFKDQGKHVLLTMDSVTRFAMAQREIGLAIGEPPTSRGYTPSTFSSLPKLVERAGNFSGKGSITAFYTVLVEGDDFNEPISDNLRAILDGHVILTRQLASRNHYPAIDVVSSVSRLANDLYNQEERAVVEDAREMMSLYQKSSDMIEIGAYVEGQNKKLDRAIRLDERLSQFCKQKTAEKIDRHTSMNQLKNAMN